MIKLDYANLLLYVGLLASIFWITVSCSSSTDPYKPYVGDKEMVYPQKIDTVMAYPSINRLFLKIPKPNDPQVNKVGVFWDNGNDSLKAEFPEDKDTLRVEIDSLEGGLDRQTYLFSIYTYDKADNESIEVSISADVLGENYLNTIQNRTIETIALTPSLGSLDLFLKWDDAPGNALGTVVKYTNASNKLDSLFVPDDSTQTRISDYKINSTIEYSTLYPIGFDTIATSFQQAGGKLHQITLKNQGPNFERADWDGCCWGNLKDWETNEAAKTHNGYGGWGYPYNQTSGTELMVFSNYEDEEGIIKNGKLYKNLELPAGSYSFSAYSYRIFSMTGENKVYLAVAEGNTLPDQENISNSKVLDYAVLEGSVSVGEDKVYTVEFTLNQKTNITLGFIAMVVDKRKFVRISQVRLRWLDKR